MIFEILLTGLIFVILMWIYKENYRSGRPPGPLRLPIIGTVLQLGVDISKPQYKMFQSLSKKYGPLSSIQLGMAHGVIFDEFETIKKLLNSEIWVDRFWNSLFAERSFGQSLGIIFINGDTWKEMRRFTMRTLRDFGYGKQKSMESVLEDEVKDLLASIDKLRAENNSVVQMKQVFSLPVLNVLWTMVCSTRTPEDDKRLKELLILVDNLARATPMAGGILIPFPYLRHIFPNLANRGKIQEINGALQQYFRDVLERRREEGVYKQDQRDYIDVFLKEIDVHRETGSSPNYYTDEQFITTTIDLFEAGAETTSNTLEFAIYYMLHNPLVQVKVQSEIDRVIGRNRLPTIADKAEMPYTEAVLTEVQRISNVVAMTVRSPTEDVWLDGYFLEKGTVGFFNIYSVHMSEAFWGDPEKFRPERFLDANEKVIPEMTQRVIPFGAGRRVCLGETLARATLFTYFTTILQQFKLDKCESESSEKEPALLGFTLTPAPYSAIINKR